MKPKTKLQVRVLGLSNALPVITEEQKAWAYKHMFDKVAYRTKTKTGCLECGHVWATEPKGKTCVCPNCDLKLTVQDTKKKKLFQSSRCVSILTIAEDFQVVRFYEAWSQHRVGEAARYGGWEICQQFINPETEKMTTVARYCAGFNGGMTGDMEIRPTTDQYGNEKFNYFSENMYPVMQVQPLYARNGLVKPVDNVQPYNLCKKLTADSRCETLLKANQLGLLAIATSGNKQGKISTHWNSLKICIRNNYKIKDANSYLDYLDLLAYFSKDLRSAHYVCPANFHREHNRYVKKKKKVYEQQLRDRNARQAEAARLKEIENAAQLITDTERYVIDKAPYFGLEFKSGDITISVLESVEAFKQEGAELAHCVYTNKYYKHVDSLCFSARVGGSRMETIEISLQTFKIEQARGKHNHASKYNKEIRELITKNMRHVKKRHAEARNVKSIAA